MKPTPQNTSDLREKVLAAARLKLLGYPACTLESCCEDVCQDYFVRMYELLYKGKVNPEMSKAVVHYRVLQYVVREHTRKHKSCHQVPAAAVVARVQRSAADLAAVNERCGDVVAAVDQLPGLQRAVWRWAVGLDLERLPGEKRARRSATENTRRYRARHLGTERLRESLERWRRDPL
jgi:hypothetical protein